MAPRRTSAREAQLAFEALSIEGRLLAPEWLARIAQLEAGSQGEGDYRVAKGLSLRDEIGRYWRVAQAHWKELRAGLAAKGDPAALAERFADGFLREVLGFMSLATTAPVVVGERMLPVGRIALGGRVPVVVAPANVDLDESSAAFGDGGRRRSAFGLAQEYLNVKDDAVWGIATNACTFRILRDNSSLTRPAWIEADLARIFDEELYADFAALWLLAHETRFSSAERPATDCPLETWRVAGRAEGTRARDKLRNGVEDALLELGNGFLSHPENGALRAALREGKLSAAGYFQELLRLVYRVIFLLAVEERGLLHAEASREAERKLYAEGYGLRRLRDRAVRRSAHDRFSDLWEGLKIVFRGLAQSEPRLALPALGGLFDPTECPSLDAAKLQNRALLTAMFRLAWLHGKSGLERVNWRDMGPEELGSVYEGLLELVPQLVDAGHAFAFATGGEAKGNARKLTGSYYTPESLVQLLIESALEPVVKNAVAAHPQDGAEALLRLAIVDPACGSGHFLLAAADRLAAHVARLQANGTPTPAQRRAAVRQVVSRCIFGVDLNPLAVELCRVSLWMEAVEPGRPLTFLNSHVQCGNALLGTTPELLAKGVPDVAWEPIEGDDKKTASYFKGRNRRATEGQRAISFARDGEDEGALVAGAVSALDAAPDASIDDVARKELSWEDLQRSPAYRHQKFVADAWCAAFVWPKPPLDGKDTPSAVEAAPTNDLWLQIRDGQGTPPRLTVKTVEELTTLYRFFHWHLVFPQVFARGGFDAVLGNPPWDASDLMKVEFFAARVPEVARARTTEDRLALIEKATNADPRLEAEWNLAQRANSGESHFTKASGAYPLTSVGKLNTYRTFAELGSQVVSSAGRVGLVLKSGIVNAQDNQEFFATLLEAQRVVSVRDFINVQGIFPDVVANERFCAFTITGAGGGSTEPTFMFCLESIAQLAERERRIELTLDELGTLNPNDLSVPPLTSARDKAILARVHSRIPVLVNERTRSNRLSARYARGHLNSSTNSGLFSANDFEQLVKRGLVSADGGWDAAVRPLIEGKLIGSWNHRFGSFFGVPRESRFGKKAEAREPSISELENPKYSPLPRFWLSTTDADRIISAKGTHYEWNLAYRHVCRAVVDARTAQVCIVPREPLSDSCALILFDSPKAEAAINAMLVTAAWTSFVGDYVLRQKIYGPALTKAIALQLPVPAPEDLDRCGHGIVTVPFIMSRGLELTYTSWDVEQYARDAGCGGPPFRWVPERRFLLRAELDAAFFHLYGISRDDADYILETFPIIRRNDEKAHGVYRTKRVIIEIFDAMAEAIRAGRPYQTRLDPPPADPRVAHLPRSPEPSPAAGRGRKRAKTKA